MELTPEQFEIFEALTIADGGKYPKFRQSDRGPSQSEIQYLMFGAITWRNNIKDFVQKTIQIDNACMAIMGYRRPESLTVDDLFEIIDYEFKTGQSFRGNDTYQQMHAHRLEHTLGGE